MQHIAMHPLVFQIICVTPTQFRQNIYHDLLKSGQETTEHMYGAVENLFVSVPILKTIAWGIDFCLHKSS
jgi:hypothetical protein